MVDRSRFAKELRTAIMRIKNAFIDGKVNNTKVSSLMEEHYLGRQQISIRY